MTTTNLRCDLCRKLTTDEGKLLEPLHGFCVSLGYSMGGWGSRQNFTPEKSYVICSTCFAKVKEKSLALAHTIAGLSGNYTVSKE